MVVAGALGIPLANLYSMELIDAGLIQQAYRRTVGSSFTETPAGICWVLHEFDLQKIDGGFLREWADTETSFPCQAADFTRMAWLLHHPCVCKVSFEELVGPKGGGSAESQIRAPARLIDFLHATDSQAERVASALYNREAFSFHQGQIGAWRKAFTAQHRRIIEERFGPVLSLYGYA